MQKAKDRFNQSKKVDNKTSEKTPNQLPGATINFDVARIFYPGDEKFTRRYSIDDNGGGYLGL
jgi:hypothetical protein